MLADAMHGSFGQTVGDGAPALPVIFADENVCMIIVVEVTVDGEINAPGSLLRRDDAADVQHRGKAANIFGEIVPMLSAIARHLNGSTVGAGVQNISIDPRLGDRRQRPEVGLAVVPG